MIDFEIIYHYKQASNARAEQRQRRISVHTLLGIGSKCPLLRLDVTGLVLRIIISYLFNNTK